MQLNGCATGGPITSPFAQAFLVFALVLWPVLVPLAAWLAEPLSARRRLMAPFLPLGAMIGLYLLYGMVTAPYEAGVHAHHIRYHSAFEHIRWIEYIYLVAISLPLMLSSAPAIALMGLAKALLLAGSKWLDQVTYVSVWCFLAAVASLCVAWNVLGRPRAAQPGLMP